MSPTAIENAVAARDALAQKIRKAEEDIRIWRAKMQRAEQFIEGWEEFSGQKAPVGNLEVRPDRMVSQEEQSDKPRNPKKEEVAEAAIEIIRAHGEPMSRDQIFEALQRKDVVIHGKNPPVVLQTMLWRMQDRIVHLKGFGYWPREDAYMAANYVVETEEAEGIDLNNILGDL